MKYIKLFEDQNNPKYTIYDVLVMSQEEADDALISIITERNIDYELLELLIKHSAVNINVEFSTEDYPELYDGYATHKSALLYVVEIGDYKAVKILLEHPEINVNVQDTMGISPLHRAVFASEYDIVDLLLSHPNININLKEDEYYRTAWDLAEEEMREFYPQLNPNL